MVGKMASKTLKWLDFLRPFNGVKSLYLSRIFALGVGSSLKELIGDRITEVLPTLQNIFADGHLWPTSQEIEGIGHFVDARRLSGHPIIVSLKGSPLELNWFKAVRDDIPLLATPTQTGRRRRRRPKSLRLMIAKPDPDPDPDSDTDQYITPRASMRGCSLDTQ
jgi:hypothetical protein